MFKFIFDFIKKNFSLIRISINNDSIESSNRIQSYYMMGVVIIMSIVFLCIEITNFIIAMVDHNAYNISNEIIIIFGMIMAQHLSILFNKRMDMKVQNKIDGKFDNIVDKEFGIKEEPSTTSTNSITTTTIDTQIGTPK
jgi:hypothetical protein